MTLRSLSKTAIDRSIIAAVVDRGEAVQTHQSHMTLVVSLLLHNVLERFRPVQRQRQLLSVPPFVPLSSVVSVLSVQINPTRIFFLRQRAVPPRL
jgi:hypothetical protein